MSAKELYVVKGKSFQLPRAKQLLICAATLAMVQGMAQAQLSITATNVPQTQNFDSLATTGTGLSQTGGIFGTGGWSFLESGASTAVNGLYTTGIGDSATGDTYSFGGSFGGGTSAADRAFGVIQTGTFSSTLGFSFTNNTGATITALRVSYTGELWRTSAAADTLAFSHQAGTPALDATGWTSQSSLNFTTPIVASPSTSNGNASTRRVVSAPTLISGLSIAPGASYSLRWVDASGADSAGMAIDDFSITANPQPFRFWNGSGTGGGSGTWNNTNSNWNDATANAGTNGTHLTNADVIFDTTTTASTVTVNQAGTGVTAGASLTFTTDGYTVAGTGASGTLTLAGATPEIAVNATTATISAPIAGSNGLTKSGAGTLVLSGANTYTGTTTIKAGVVSLGSSGALGTTGTISFEGGTLQSTSGNTTDYSARFSTAAGQAYSLDPNAQSVVLASPLASIGGSLTLGGVNGGSVTLAAANTYTGITSLRNGTLKLSHPSALPGGIAATGGTSNLVFDGAQNILGLASGDFSRGLGTGPSEVQWSTTNGSGGFAAYGADRTVNLGGAGATLTWGTGGFVRNGRSLYLGAADSNAKVTFQNPIVTTSGGTSDFSTYGGLSSITGEISGAISGPGIVRFFGNDSSTTQQATLILSGNNSYTGATQLISGVLVLKHPSALPGGVGTTGGLSNLTFGNTGVLGLGTGDFTRSLGTGSHQVQWSSGGGFAAYGSDRVVNLGGAAAQVTVGQGGFVGAGSDLFLGSSTADSKIDFQNPINFGATTGRVTVVRGTGRFDGELSGQLSGTAGVSILGSGSQALGNLILSGANTYTGTTIVGQSGNSSFPTPGVVVLANANALPGGIGSSGGTSGLTFSRAVLGLATGDFLRSVGAGAAQVQWTSNSTGGGFAAYGADRVVNLGGASDPVTWRSGGFVTAGSLYLGHSSADAKVTLQNPIVVPTGVTATIQVGNGSTDVDAELSGTLSGGGELRLTNQSVGNPGRIVLSGANTFTGTISVTNGTILRITHSDALGSTSGGSGVGSDSAIELIGGLNIGAEPLQLAGSGAGNTGALRSISGNNTFAGLLSITTSTRINTESGTLVLSNTGSIVPANAPVVTFGGNGDTVLAGAMGGGSIVKDGSGTLTLTGADPFRGPVTVSSGVVNVRGSSANVNYTSALGVSFGAAIELQGGINVGATSQTLTLNGTGISSGGALRSVSGDNSLNVKIALASSARINSDAGNLSLAGGAATLTGSYDLFFGGLGNIAVFRAIDIAAGAVVKDGAGVLSLNVHSAYSGGTTLTSGVIRVASSTATSGQIVTAGPLGTGSLNLNGGRLSSTTTAARTIANPYTIGGNVALGDPIVNGTFTLSGSGIVSGARTLTVDSPVVISGAISGAGSLEKTGSSTLTLSSTSNSFDGTTTVTAGTLIVNGTLGASTNTVTVGSAGTLAGTGLVQRPIDVYGTLAPGNSIGTLQLGDSLQLRSGSILQIEVDAGVGGTSDRVTGVTDLALGGSLNVIGIGNFTTLSAGRSWSLISYTGSVSGVLGLGSAPALAEGLRWQISSAGGNVSLSINVVPEPMVLASTLSVLGVVSLRRVRFNGC